MASRHPNYRFALSTPGALAFFVAALPPRVGIAMTGLGIVWLVHATAGSYGTAGLVTGAFAIAEAGVGPQVARIVDRYSQPRVLPLLLMVHGGSAAALVGLAVAGSPVVALVAAGAVMGASIPQIGALTAARWSHLLRGTALLPAAFALETFSNEVAHLVGPAAVATVGAFGFPAVGLVTATVLVVGGGLVFASRRRSAPPPRHQRGSSDAGPLLNVRFAVLVGVNACFGVFFGCMQIGITAFAVERGIATSAGLFYAVSSVASVLAGLLYGLVAPTTRKATQLTCALGVLAGGCGLLATASGPALLVAGVVVTGAALAPCLVLCGVLTERAAPAAAITQAFTWTNSACAAGTALAGAIAGNAVDHAGARAAFWVALAVTLVATCAAATLLRPAARRRGSSSGGRPGCQR